MFSLIRSKEQLQPIKNCIFIHLLHPPPSFPLSFPFFFSYQEFNVNNINTCTFFFYWNWFHTALDKSRTGFLCILTTLICVMHSDFDTPNSTLFFLRNVIKKIIIHFFMIKINCRWIIFHFKYIINIFLLSHYKFYYIYIFYFFFIFSLSVG